jgi:uncharacterized glyoxalase superfamily protein PhnB
VAKLTRIAPELPVLNLQQTLSFYQQKLGFRVAMQMPEANYAIVERDEIALHLFEDDLRRHSSVGIHLFTPDLDALCAEVKERGAHLSQETERKPWGNREFRLKDEFGNELKFTEPLAEDK